MRAFTRVEIALFNGFALPEVAVLIEIFQRANALSAHHPHDQVRYEVVLLSAQGGRVASSSSVFIWTESVDGQRHAAATQLLFVAGGAGAHHACQDLRLVDWLRREYPLSEIVHPIAEGKSLLNAASLSSKHRSHPPDGTLLRAPNRPRAMRETHGVFRTALRIIEEDLGIDLAERIAASLVTPKRVPLNALPVKNANRQISEKIKASVLWLDANVEQPISIDTAAEVAAMSERNFLRRFKNEIGMTPSDYLLRARLNLSCQMLLESSLPVDKIARRCGFSNGGQLAKLFRKYFSKTPTDYRTKKDAATSTSAKVHGMSGSEAEDVIEPDRMPCR